MIISQFRSIKNSFKIPALSESAPLRYFNFIALYFAEGLPMGMLFIGIPAWLAMNDKTPSQIGGFGVACSLPWTFKFFVAPLMDRYTFLPMGRKRPWVIFSQMGLFLSLALMAFVPDPLNNLSILMAAAFLVSVFGAVQDAASDGMAVDVVPANQQARANGFMGGARMIGSSLALALGSWLLNKYNFTVAMLSISFMIGLVLLVPILLREHQGEKILPWTNGKESSKAKKLQMDNWSTIFKSLYKVFRLRNSLAVAFLLFITQGSYNYFETSLDIFAVKVSGWTNVFYSQAFATADLIGGIGGMLIGGLLIEKFGKKRMISIYFLLLISEIIILIVAHRYWRNTTFIYSFIIVYRWLNAFAKIGVYAVAMQCCSKMVSASQFTFYMTVGAIGSMVGAALIGPMKENFSWEITFMSFAFLMFLSLLTILFINLDKLQTQITSIEKKEIEEPVLT